MLNIVELTCEYRENPLGIDNPFPRFSWKLESERRGTVQAAWQLQAATDETFNNLVWDSGKVEGEDSIHRAYEGEKLSPHTCYHVRVKVWDNYGEESPWRAGTFETGLLDSGWQAQWITCDLPKNPPSDIPPWILRREFELKGKVASARAYATALGVYELSLNGSPADDSKLNPGWTSYNNWLQYQVYDVTPLLHQGGNTLEVLLGEGWYSSEFTFKHLRELYGKENALLLELHVRYSDGVEEIITSGEEFKASTGPILFSSFYDGEVYDARLEPGNCRNWQPVRILEYKTDHLTANVNLPVRPMEEIAPVELITTPKGERVLDMGQNMVGYLRFRVRGKAGDRVVLKHAEVLDKDGNFYFDNIREAKQEIVYTLRGNGVEEFEPHFTFQGFRYVKVLEYPGEIALGNFTGVVLHTDMKQTGEFSCSNPLVNGLQHNILWGQKGNFVDVPTDCPQRDERLGWTADAQVFIPTACFNMDCALFFQKWLKDLRFDQHENGAVPFIVPNVLPTGWGPLKETGDDHASATWGDAATIGPWVLYERYGDLRFLEDSYESMKKWVAYMEAGSGEGHIWRGGAQLGDWLALDAFEGSYRGATPEVFVATAYFAYSTGILAKTAAVLGEKEDQKRYKELYAGILTAFQKEFFQEGKLTFDTQTGYILPLMFDLVKGDLWQACIDGLVAHLERNNIHLTTGFVGTPYLCDALCKGGRTDLAYRLLLQEDFPSWLYQVKTGATTVWEHWDGIKPDGSMWSADMNSFNHYAYGSIGDWLYRTVAGINADEEIPGYKQVRFAPRITEELDWAKAGYDSPYGRVALEWRRTGNSLEVAVEVPANAAATLELPGLRLFDFQEGGKAVEGRPDLQVEADRVLLGSGSYRFTCTLS